MNGEEEFILKCFLNIQGLGQGQYVEDCNMC